MGAAEQAAAVSSSRLAPVQACVGRGRRPDPRWLPGEVGWLSAVFRSGEGVLLHILLVSHLLAAGGFSPDGFVLLLAVWVGGVREGGAAGPLRGKAGLVEGGVPLSPFRDYRVRPKKGWQHREETSG